MRDILKETNIEYMDIAKAYAIILVVIGHAGAPFTNFIYLFHMALFFFISGYFYKDKYSDNPIRLIINRLKTLYIPFLKYELIYLFLHNVFFDFFIYSDKTGYLNQGSNLYTNEQFISALKSIIKFVGTEQLAGAFWFLTTLFWVNLIFVVISFVTIKVFKQYYEYIRFILILLSFILGNSFTYNNYEFYYSINVSLVAVSIYYCGYLYRKNEAIIRMNIISALLSLVFLIYNSFNGHIEMGLNKYPSPMFFLFNSLIGIYLIIYISKILTNKDIRLLKYIGKNSLTIMALHFLCFKIVNLIQINVYSYPIYMMAKFPYIDGGNGWWILYSLIGVLVPITLVFIYENISKILKEYFTGISNTIIRFKERTLD